MTRPVLGVLGGSGLYAIDGVEVTGTREVDTPFGSPSDALTTARTEHADLLFLPRHGRGHRHSPTEVNYRANVAAMKIAGATHLVSVSAVGSMKEAIEPGHLVVIDQTIDLTKRRASTFFEGGVVAHVAFADPFCPLLRGAVAAAAREASGAVVHDGGTYVCIEGPQFSTRAESRLYRSWGVDVIGMTAMPEAKLAREAELPYATLALSTDYDCWREGHDAVTLDEVLSTMSKNVAAAKRALVALAGRLPDATRSPAHRALDSAIVTDRARIPEATRRRLAFLRPFGA